MRPTPDLDDRIVGIEMVVGRMRVGDEIALVAGDPRVAEERRQELERQLAPIGREPFGLLAEQATLERAARAAARLIRLSVEVDG